MCCKVFSQKIPKLYFAKECKEKYHIKFKTTIFINNIYVFHIEPTVADEHDLFSIHECDKRYSYDGIRLIASDSATRDFVTTSD